MYSSFDNDEDFIAFWKTNAQFFAYYVILSRKYSKFYEDDEFLLEYLQQRGLYICDDETLENLTYLMKHYFNEIRKRGTIEIVRKRTVYDLDDNSDSDSASDSYGRDDDELDGELLRLICFDKCNEFIFNFRKSEKLGLNIRNSSPLYRGTSNMEGANKVWAQLLTATDYLKYPLFGSVTTTVEADESDSDSNSDALINTGYALQIDSGTSGFGLDGVSVYSLAYINEYALNVDVNIDYEFTFRIKQDVGATAFGNGTILNFGCHAFDCDGNAVNITRMRDSVVSTVFESSKALNQLNKYYFFRGVIYGKNKFPTHVSSEEYKENVIVRVATVFYRSILEVPVGILISNTTYWVQLSTVELNSHKFTNWNSGNALQFSNDVKKIIPYIKVVNGNVTTHVFVDNVNIKPVATNYSGGFIQTNNWIDAWIKNNNQNYTYKQISEIAKRYLLPYDSEMAINQLEEETQI